VTERLRPPVGRRVRETTVRAADRVQLRAGTRLFRVHPLDGEHPQRWDEMRTWGPTSSRFDHQPPPPRMHPTRAIAYATCGPRAFVAALAEYFQDGDGSVGPIDPSARVPTITVFETAGPLRLLDLDGGWVTRAGGNQAIRSGPRGMCRAWARAIYRHHPDVHGLAYGSSTWGPGRCVALWERGAHAFGPRPLATRPLQDPAMLGALEAAAEELGTFVVPLGA
jgi:hypothetical protein